MDILEKLKAIQFIRPNAHFSIQDDELIWLDENQTEPTEKEIEAGLIAYNSWKKEQDEDKIAKKLAAEAKLAALGLTTDDLKALGLA